MTLKVVHAHFGKDGGAERFFVNLVNSLNEQGVEQKIVIRPNRIWRREIEHCGEILENHYRRVSLSGVMLEFRFRRLLREFKPDAVLSWMPRASRLMQKRDGAIRLARLGDFPKNLKHFGNCDALIANVPGIARRCRDLGWEKPVQIISNFPRQGSGKTIDRSKLGTPEDAMLVTAAGRFVPRKGFDLLIRAVARLDNAHLWLIGEGQEAGNLQRLASEAGASGRVHFVGWQDDPSAYVAASDIFCMPSRHEPLGNVILEAWSVGVPVVSSRSEGPSWFMRDGENGLLVEIDDVDGFATALERLRGDAALRKKIVEGGQETLARQFSKESITRQYMKLFSGQFEDHGI
jgi:glycosyltransferase involved in cell wall biosynthesis